VKTHKRDDRRYAARREELIVTLEAVYNALDTHEPDIEAPGRAGVTPPLDRLGAS
jgi:hypothetical protein